MKLIRKIRASYVALLLMVAVMVLATPAHATDGDYSTDIAAAFTTYTTNVSAWASAAITLAVAVGAALLVKGLIKRH